MVIREKKKMMIKPLVTIITPTTHDRLAFNIRCREVVKTQDYKNIEWLVSYKQYPTLGEKMNAMCNDASGELIVNIDSDDLYAPDWVSRCVALWQETQADVIGLKIGYFYREPEMFTYTYPQSDKCLFGATMCHTKEFWQRNKYNHKQVGYDVDFTQKNCNVAVLDYSEGFIATVHKGNVSPKNISGDRWAKVENIPTSVHNLLTRFPLGS